MLVSFLILCRECFAPFARSTRAAASLRSTVFLCGALRSIRQPGTRYGQRAATWAPPSQEMKLEIDSSFKADGLRLRIVLFDGGMCEAHDIGNFPTLRPFSSSSFSFSLSKVLPSPTTSQNFRRISTLISIGRAAGPKHRLGEVHVENTG